MLKSQREKCIEEKELGELLGWGKVGRFRGTSSGGKEDGRWMMAGLGVRVEGEEEMGGGGGLVDYEVAVRVGVVAVPSAWVVKGDY